jgi:oxygen-independent coproporphyrinogen-3 oxidase
LRTVSQPGSPIEETRPLGVYVHFPFCTTRCPYCDFAVVVKREIPHAAYADVLLQELAKRAPAFIPTASPGLVSIYFGGGTPGLWRTQELGRVLGAVRTHFAAREEPEVTVEVNPGDLDPSALSALRSLGVNRLSFGAQAFQDRLLRRIGRHHDRAAIGSSFAAARRAGFDNLCADLMFGLPEQSMQDWRDSLAALVAHAPEHITAYALTVEDGTRFGALDRAGKLARPNDEMTADMYVAGHDILTAAGYEHYEISSYAKLGRRSRHNSLYWTMGAYLGLGVSAASFQPLPDGTGWRLTNQRSLAAYLRQWSQHPDGQSSPTAEHRSPAQLEEEALWLALRTADGVARREHAQRYGRDPLGWPGREAAARTCADAGWLEITPDRLRLRPAGFLFADEVAVRLWGAAGRSRA